MSASVLIRMFNAPEILSESEATQWITSNFLLHRKQLFSDSTINIKTDAIMMSISSPRKHVNISSELELDSTLSQS